MAVHQTKKKNPLGPLANCNHSGNFGAAREASVALHPCMALGITGKEHLFGVST